MGIVWEQRIKHIYLKVKRRDYRLVASANRELNRRKQAARGPTVDCCGD